MVDLHQHLLPGLDDGSPDLDISLAMARMAVEEGITHVVATPHASSRYDFDPALIAERLALLRGALAERGIPLQLATGCDFHMSYENIRDALAHPRKYTLNASAYLLVELPDLAISPHVSELFYQLRLSGMVPILTHPERNPRLQSDIERLKDWLRHDLLVQVTAGSVLGQMGKAAERMAHMLLANRWVHFLATDAHDVRHRPPQMREAHRVVAERYGEEYADRLCTGNPLAVFEGRDLPEQDEPLHLYGDEMAGQPWWKRIFGS
jgi:protein-tyrosine phosphatase